MEQARGGVLHESVGFLNSRGKPDAGPTGQRSAVLFCHHPLASSISDHTMHWAAALELEYDSATHSID